MDIDHKNPMAKGGSDQRRNLQLICRTCNTRKGATTDRQFRTKFKAAGVPTTQTPPTKPIPQSKFDEIAKKTAATKAKRSRNTRTARHGAEKLGHWGGGIVYHLPAEYPWAMDKCQGRRRSGWPLPSLPTRPNRTARLWQTNISPKQPVQRPEPEGRIRHLQLHTGDPLRPDAPQIAGHREDPKFLALRIRNVHPETGGHSGSFWTPAPPRR